MLVDHAETQADGLAGVCDRRYDAVDDDLALVVAPPRATTVEPGEIEFARVLEKRDLRQGLHAVIRARAGFASVLSRMIA